VWLYHRFTLNFQDIEELLAARRIVVSYEAIRHGVVNNLFWLGRHSMKESNYSVFCDRVFVECSWASCVQNLT
jgi:transposase-like protein